MLTAALGLSGWLYRVLFLLHIAAAIVGFGGVVLNALYDAQIRKRIGAGAATVAEVNFAVSMVAEKFIYAVPVLGLLMVWASDGGYTLGITWIWLSLVIYVAAIGLSHSVVIPGVRRINSLLAGIEDDPPVDDADPQIVELDGIRKKVAGSGVVLNLTLVVMLALMIWKPS